MGELRAGAAAADISPLGSQFLFGYPHVERYSTGIHDPLLSSALYLSDGQRKVMFGTNYPMIAHAHALAGLDRLGLSDEAVRDFLHGNAERVFGELHRKAVT